MKLNRLVIVASHCRLDHPVGLRASSQLFRRNLPRRFQTTSGTNRRSRRPSIAPRSLERNQPLVALDAYANAARDSLRELESQPGEYRSAALLQFCRRWHLSRDPHRPSSIPGLQPLRCRCEQRIDSHREDADPAKPEQNPALYDLIPTDELRYHGAYVKDDVTKDGIGAPLVAVRHLTAEQAAALFTATRNLLQRHGVSRNSKGRVASSQSTIHWPRKRSRVEGHTYPLAANFTASLRDGAGRGKTAKTWAHPSLASGGIRLHRPGRPAGALQSKQDGRARHPWPDGHAGHLGANAKRFARRSRRSGAITSFGFTVTPAVIPIPIARSFSARNSTPSKRNIPCAKRWW